MVTSFGGASAEDRISNSVVTFASWARSSQALQLDPLGHWGRCKIYMAVQTSPCFTDVLTADCPLLLAWCALHVYRLALSSMQAKILATSAVDPPGSLTVMKRCLRQGCKALQQQDLHEATKHATSADKNMYTLLQPCCDQNTHTVSAQPA